MCDSLSPQSDCFFPREFQCTDPRNRKHAVPLDGLSEKVSLHSATLYTTDPFTSEDPTDWTVNLGDHDINLREPHEQKRKISTIIIHPDYLSMWFEGIYDTPPTNDVGKSQTP